mgnify:CR=1 FL=1
MKKYTVVSLATLTVLIAVAAGIASAADNVSNGTSICNVVGTHYECSSWSNEQYPVIDLFGDTYVPLLASNGSICQSHVNKLANLVLDSNETHTLKPGEKIDLGHGYALEVMEIDIDSENVWLEFTKDGQCVADQNILVGTDSNNTWTVTLDNIQGENDIVVMKVHVKQLFVGTETSVIWIDGIWLIDYANARTLNVGDKLGEFTLEQIISGTDSSNQGSLAFKNTSVADDASVNDDSSDADSSDADSSDADSSSSSSPERRLAKLTNEKTESPTSWYWNFWECIIMRIR